MLTPWLNDRPRSMDRFNKLMEQAFGDFAGGSLAWSPNVDVKETENVYTVLAELPGLKLEDVHVELNGDVLTISGSRESKKEDKGENFIHRECSYGKFQRSFTLGGSVKPDGIEASFKDGVLKIEVPKVAGSPAKRIEVKAG